MHANKLAVTIFLTFMASFCVTEKTQNMPQETPASGKTTITSDENTQPYSPEGQNKVWLSYEPTVVELKGKLITRMYYGPPNYGENPDTDLKEVMPVLLLSEPVSVRGETDANTGYRRPSVEDVREMQLVLSIPHKKLIGKVIISKGTLFQANTGHHHTPVLMDVQSISLARSD